MGGSWGARVSMQFGSHAEVLVDLPCRGAGGDLFLLMTRGWEHNLSQALVFASLIYGSLGAHLPPVPVRCPCCCGFCQHVSILPIFSLWSWKRTRSLPLGSFWWLYSALVEMPRIHTESPTFRQKLPPSPILLTLMKHHAS